MSYYEPQYIIQDLVELLQEKKLFEKNVRMSNGGYYYHTKHISTIVK